MGNESTTTAACRESLIVTPTATNCGSWSSPCHQYVEVDCPGSRCYWYDKADERKSVTLAELQVLQREHDKYARRRVAEDEREREMRELERQMHAMAYDDPKRRAVVDRYNAVCDKLGVPSGDK